MKTEIDLLLEESEGPGPVTLEDVAGNKLVLAEATAAEFKGRQGPLVAKVLLAPPVVEGGPA